MEKIVEWLIAGAVEEESARLDLSEEFRKKASLTMGGPGLRPLGTLPNSIGELTRLKELRISGNQLRELPDSIGNLSQLQRLWASGNRLRNLPDSIGKLADLHHLDVHNNELEKLPDSIGNLAQLRELNLHSNRLTELPDSIGYLIHLKWLFFFQNHLNRLPKTIGNLRQLLELSVCENELEFLPESIGSLTELQRLDLSQNMLKELPTSMRRLHALEELYLHGNHGLGLPMEVLGPPHERKAQSGVGNLPRKIIDYYMRIRAEEDRRPLNEAKLILVGRGGVGKTSIVKRLVRNDFSHDEKKTEGIGITEWMVSPNEIEHIRLNVWDFGGQEIMHGTHQFFLTQRSLYLLVLNGRDGLADFDTDYWLRLTESFGGDSPVIVVLNKINEHPFDVNRRAYQQKFPAIRDFVETDCEDGTGFEELRKAIMRETDRLEHLRDAFPASWFDIKSRLAGMTENYLTFEQYRQICVELGEADEDAQETLAFSLHSLGIVLNYMDDARLRDTHVLNPHWVTDGIYKIINSAKLDQQKGRISLRDVCDFMDCSLYPTATHCFLFDLMKKFELCFNFPEKDDYLIPELLDKQEPDTTAAFTPKLCLNFQYHYSVLPEGLLPRFIVRTHKLSNDRSWWRTGIILDFEGNSAVIKADVQDKKVYISVSGPVATRRNLLAIIRSHFQDIHSTFSQLMADAMIPLPSHPNVVVPYTKLVVMAREAEKTFKEVVGEKVIVIDVDELLNGIELHPKITQSHGMDTAHPAERGQPDTSVRTATHININVGGPHMDDYHVGQAPAVGPGAHAHDMTFNQIWNEVKESVDLPKLAGELAVLREQMKKGGTTVEHDAALGDVSKAEQAAKAGDGAKTLEHLKSAGKWALDAATKIGTSLAAEMLKKSLLGP